MDLSSLTPNTSSFKRLKLEHGEATKLKHAISAHSDGARCTSIKSDLRGVVKLLNIKKFATCGVLSGVKIGTRVVIIFNDQYYVYTQQGSPYRLVHNPDMFVAMVFYASGSWFDLEDMEQTFCIVPSREYMIDQKLFCETIVGAINTATAFNAIAATATANAKV